MSLRVRCSNKANGCDWVREFTDLEQHTRDCGYAQVTCPNECTEFGADNAPPHITLVLKKDLEEHLNNECQRRSIFCPNCNERGEYQEITTIHTNSCVEAKLQCPNELCKQTFLRKELAGHKRVCKHQLIPCKYQELGCTIKDFPKEIQKHEEENKIHFPLLLRSFIALKKEYSILKEEVRILKALHKFVFKLPNFKQYKDEKRVFKSPPFFTHNQGYKMVIGITPHGYSHANGTHVSVHFYLVQGPYDEQLTWPFSGTLHIELLNQLDDNHHHRKTVNVHGIIVANSLNEPNMVGWGIPYFIQNEQLGYSPNKHCQYLKDDCVVFRVVAHITGHTKWLQCSEASSN